MEVIATQCGTNSDYAYIAVVQAKSNNAAGLN